MKSLPIKIIIIVAVLAIILGLFLSFGKKQGEIVARVNGDPVYDFEANERLKILSRGKGDIDYKNLDDKSKFIIIKELAAHKLVLEEANDKNVGKKEEIQNKVESYKNSLIKEAFLRSVAEESVSESNLKSRYEDLMKTLKGQTQYRVRHILLDSKKAANKVIKKIKGNKELSFEKVAMEDSLDKVTAVKGGDLGYLLSGSISPEFNDIIPSLKVGQISKPVKTKIGWHVIKVDEVRPAEAMKFEEVKAALANEVSNDAARKYVEELMKNSEIELISNNVKLDDKGIKSDLEDEGLEDSSESLSDASETGAELTEDESTSAN